jgi:hypothetical protein
MKTEVEKTKVKAYGLGVYIMWFFTLLTLLDIVHMIERVAMIRKVLP